MNHLPKLIELCRHPSIQGRRGKWQDADTYAIESGKWAVENHHTDHHSAITRHQQGWEPIWLPPLSDPIQPERGLWGMINWNRWNMYVFQIGCACTITRRETIILR